MKLSFVLPVIISFGISVILCPIVIPFLQKLKFGQYIREEGPEAHLKKAGTPTMGGLIILVSILVTSFIYVGNNREIIPVLFMTLGFGLIGFLDDYIKVVMKRSLGLKPLQKMLAQFVVATIFIVYLLKYTDVGTTIIIPFTGGSTVTMPIWLFVAMAYFAIIGTVNGVNLTDGLDGLASGVTVIVATFFTVCALAMGSEITPVTCAVVGALLGFLLYNVYPARVFMGDTGSLALGGFVIASAFMLRMPLFVLIVGFIYLIEILSDIIQVTYYKKTGGKRFFKMAPIHHHFELSGWSETRVVAVFTIATALLCLIGLVAL